MHDKRATPVFGLVVSSVLVTGLMFMNYTKGLVDQFDFITLLATLATLVPYAYSAAAQVVSAMREPGRFEPGRFVGDTVIATLAFAVSVWAFAGAGQDIIAKGFVLLMLGVPVHVLMIGWRRREAGQGVLPGASARAQVEAAQRHPEVVA